MKKAHKVLLVSGFLPSHRVPSGGQQLVYNVAREQAKTSELTLLAFYNIHERAYYNEEDFAFCHKTKIIKLTLGLRLFAWARYPRLPIVASSRYAAAKRWLRRELSENSYDRACFEFIQVASLCEEASVRVPTTLVVHDLFHEAIERRAANARGVKASYLSWEAKRTQRWEAATLRHPTELVTLTQKDRDKIVKMSGRENVTVRYPSRSVSGRYPRTERSVVPYTILFFGQMSRDENVDGMVWFTQSILPLIRKVIPQARLVIAGARPTKEVMALAGAAIEVTGFVETPDLLFSQAHLAIAPLRLGAGIKIKVVEYIAAGIPTVATTVGAEGVRSSPLLTIVDKEDAFAAACINILDAK